MLAVEILSWSTNFYVVEQCHDVSEAIVQEGQQESLIRAEFVSLDQFYPNFMIINVILLLSLFRLCGGEDIIPWKNWIWNLICYFWFNLIQEFHPSLVVIFGDDGIELDAVDEDIFDAFFNDYVKVISCDFDGFKPFKMLTFISGWKR